MTRPLVAVTLVALVVLAGCSGGGPERAVVTGSPATIDDGATSATGYDYVGTTNRTLNTTVHASISGDVQMNADRPVTATTPVATYRRATDGGPALALVTVAPAVRPIENQPVARDPLATLSPSSLVTYVQSTYTVDTLSETGNRSVSFLGNETSAVTYTGTAQRQGQSVTVRVTIAAVRHEGEFVTVVAVRRSSEADGERFERLLTGVTH